MERGKETEGGETEEAGNNSSGSFSVLSKDIVSFLDLVERLKSEANQNVVDADLIENLKLALAFICSHIQLSYCDLEQYDCILTEFIEDFKELVGSVDLNVGMKYGMHHLLTCITDNIDDCINSCDRCQSSATMTEEQLHFLLLNLHNISKCFAEQSSQLETEYGFLRNVCRNIKDFHGLKMSGCIEDETVEYVLLQFQPLAERIGLFFWDVQLNGDSSYFRLARLLLKIIPIELEVVHICFTKLKASESAEVERFIEQLLKTSPGTFRKYLIHLQEHMVNVTTNSTSGVQNIHVIIEFLLIILTDMPKDFIHQDKLFDVLARVGALTREVSILVHNLEEEKSENEESNNETNRATQDLLENIELLKGDFKHVYLKTPVGSSQLRCHMSDGSVFMHLLLGHLKDLLNSKAYSVALMKEEIELVKKDLELLRSFFENVDQHQLYKDLWICVLDVAYEMKDIIDSIIVRDNGLLHLIFSLPVAIEKLNLIIEQVSNLSEKIPKKGGLTVVNSPNVESKSSTTGQIIVGFKEETDLIIRMLISGSTELDVISITGMPGLGKTTLAYKVYNDKLVCNHFDIRVWCTVGQDAEKLLEKIFKQVIGSDSKVSEDIDDVDDKLRKCLFGKRYLIVLDDLWDIDTWDELTRPFPDVAKGSRIVLTTREKGVALHGRRCSDPLDLRLLRLEEIWGLFEKRLFGEENQCPDELLDVGKEMAKSCKGLPLVADLIVGILAREEREKSAWLEVTKKLNSFTFEDKVDVLKVLELSYNHLPDHLKPCLLYFASSPKDTELEVDWLKAFWCAEGFVEPIEMKSIEEVAEVYLDRLLSSSLVISFNEIHEYRTFKIHDLVHDFCSIKAKKEKLFGLIRSSDPSSSSDLVSRQMSIDFDEELFRVHPHLHDNFVLHDSEKKKYFGKHLYSLRMGGDHISDIWYLRHLRLLRVLNLDPSFVKVDSYLLNEICMLVHLRLLSIGLNVKSLPLSFSNLWNLETLMVETDRQPLVLLPVIWSLVKLRTLKVYVCSFFDLSTCVPIIPIAEKSKLEKLRILELLSLSYSKDTKDIFKRFPNLEQLTFTLMTSLDCSTGQYWFPELDFLNELQSLFVVLELCTESSNSSSVVGRTNLWDFHFPSSLKCLKLLHFPLTVDSLSTIGKLANLEELHLEETIIDGGEWTMGEEDSFENLKLLGLQGGNLVKWEVGEESFPVLEQLILDTCHKLEEIPPTFGDIYSMKSIKLIECPPHLEESALNVKQYVEDMTGNDKLKVLVLNES